MLRSSVTLPLLPPVRKRFLRRMQEGRRLPHSAAAAPFSIRAMGTASGDPTVPLPLLVAQLDDFLLGPRAPDLVRPRRSDGLERGQLIGQVLLTHAVHSVAVD